MPLGVTRATIMVRDAIGRARGRRPSEAMLLRRAALRWPDRLAVIDDDGSLTLAELYQGVAELAGALHARGLGPRSTVGTACHQHTGLIEVLLAAAWLGADIVMIDPAVDADGLREALRHTPVDLLVHDLHFSRVVGRADLAVTTLVSDSFGSGSVVGARSFGHPAPRPQSTVPAWTDDTLAAIATEIVHGRSVRLSARRGSGGADGQG